MSFNFPKISFPTKISNPFSRSKVPPRAKEGSFSPASLRQIYKLRGSGSSQGAHLCQRTDKHKFLPVQPQDNVRANVVKFLAWFGTIVNNDGEGDAPFRDEACAMQKRRADYHLPQLKVKAESQRGLYFEDPLTGLEAVLRFVKDEGTIKPVLFFYGVKGLGDTTSLAHCAKNLRGEIPDNAKAAANLAQLVQECLPELSASLAGSFPANVNASLTKLTIGGASMGGMLAYYSAAALSQRIQGSVDHFAINPLEPHGKVRKFYEQALAAEFLERGLGIANKGDYAAALCTGKRCGHTVLLPEGDHMGTTMLKKWLPELDRTYFSKADLAGFALALRDVSWRAFVKSNSDRQGGNVSREDLDKFSHTILKALIAFSQLGETEELAKQELIGQLSLQYGDVIAFLQANAKVVRSLRGGIMFLNLLDQYPPPVPSGADVTALAQRV